MKGEKNVGGHAIGDVRIWDTGLWDVYPVEMHAYGGGL
jgi:hypothetical protein